VQRLRFWGGHRVRAKLWATNILYYGLQILSVARGGATNSIFLFHRSLKMAQALELKQVGNIRSSYNYGSGDQGVTFETGTVLQI